MMNTSPNNETEGQEQFFERNYQLLREQPPMKWMSRLFTELTAGSCPKLIDLPTGAGKTDAIIVWILALSWHGLQRGTIKPVPRRLVWVVNRRVLVQQVFRLANRLQEKLAENSTDKSLMDIRAGLAELSADGGDLFRVVQLRGQLIDDREWSVVPSAPQLIIGTVDQIGSRLLFQGYSLGKWSRPLQAALLAIDAWICVDEAHLVPAFVLTLRQLPAFTVNATDYLPKAISSVFDRLPFWITELSATPALPSPGSAFRLSPDDEYDPRLADRLLAARTRKVQIRWIGKEQKLEDSIQKAAADLAGDVETIAVFVRKAGDANRIGKKLESQFKGRTLTITGRLRGYERDRLEMNKIFQRFGPAEDSDTGEAAKPAFLVGTAAAEVGLDADAEAIICDFASLPTLLQRLGRLDRRGRVSRAFHAGEGGAPTMTIFSHRPKKVAPETQARTQGLAKALFEDKSSISASLLVGKHWREALTKATNEDNPEGDQEKQGADANKLISEATWEVLLGSHSGREGDDNLETGAPGKPEVANPPDAWLKHHYSCVTGGPVAVPSLTLALIEHWSGTTKPKNDFLPVHPFLYGILPDEEGTPLVGIAFRLEMDALAAAALPEEDEVEEEEDEADGQVVASQIQEIFRLFPPRRAELHFVPISTARTWFSSEEALAIPVAHFDGDEWSAAPDREESSQIRPGSIMVLPTAAGSHDSLKVLIEDDSDTKDFSRDVLEGVSTKRPAYWRRIVQVSRGEHRLDTKDGASRIGRSSEVHDPSAPECSSLGETLPGPTWEPRLRRSLKIGTSTFRFEYLKPKRPIQQQLLDDSDGFPGHLTRAQTEANRIAEALAPGNEFLSSLLVETARVHDEGKRNCKWQRAMGNVDCARPVAKPLIKRPLSMGGFRHEWESLLKMRGFAANVPASLSESDAQEWTDLWLHLIASHHGHLRPWISDNGFTPEMGKQQQSALRLQSAERFARLQRRIGPWQLAYLEALIKAADVASSQPGGEEEDSDEQ
jgi:CRISPR-associated endonuclease/helicase Cas3